MEIDLIRMTFVFISGAFLCASGSLTQLVTNNSIASPSTLGMDGVAVLTLIFSQFFLLLNPGISSSLGIGSESLAFLIFLFIVLGFAFLNLFKKSDRSHIWDKLEMKKVIILGLSFNLFVGAIFSIIQFMFMALNYDFPANIWFGHFKQYQAQWLYFYIALSLFSFLAIFKLSSKLTLLNLGREFAIGRGVNVEKLQNQCLVLSLILTGSVICFFGVFSFLGLIFPHLLRSIPGFNINMRWELNFGPIIAGIVLCAIDFFCYNLTFYGAELPVGMTSSIIGAFFLILLVWRQKV